MTQKTSLSILRQIFVSTKQLLLALLFGLVFGLHGLFFHFTDLGPLLTFGGPGHFLMHSAGARLWLPILYCLYAYLIIRFQFKGILTVAFFHYTSMIFVSVLWIDFHAIFKEYHFLLHDPIGLPLFVPVVIGDFLFPVLYNLLFLYLFYRNLRKRPHLTRQT